MLHSYAGEFLVRYNEFDTIEFLIKQAKYNDIKSHYFLFLIGIINDYKGKFELAYSYYQEYLKEEKNKENKLPVIERMKEIKVPVSSEII